MAKQKRKVHCTPNSFFHRREQKVQRTVLRKKGAEKKEKRERIM
ncbi:MAG: hypothetical protein AAB967_00670 [Patescibacteria group bacterium]